MYSAPKIPHPIFNGLKKIAIGKTLFLAIVWMHVTSSLPLLINGAEWKGSDVLFCLSRFFLLYAICILFDRRDRLYDQSLGIRSLITWMSENNIRRLFYLSLILFGLVSIFLLDYSFRIPEIAGILSPGVLLALLYTYAINSGGDIFYYFILDGFMALSSLFSFVVYFAC